MTSKDIVSTMRSKIIVATIIQSNCNNVMKDSTEDMKGPRRFFPYGKAKRTANSLFSYRVILTTKTAGRAQRYSRLAQNIIFSAQ